MKIKAAIIEALKGLARNVLLAIIPTFTVALQNVANGVSVDWKLVGVVSAALAGLATLQFIDSLIHESNSKFNGLLPF